MARLSLHWPTSLAVLIRLPSTLGFSSVQALQDGIHAVLQTIAVENSHAMCETGSAGLPGLRTGLRFQPTVFIQPRSLPLAPASGSTVLLEQTRFGIGQWLGWKR